MTRVLVVGDVINDVIVMPLGRPATGSDSPATIRHRPGGSAANQAAWLGHLGARVVFAGRAGARDVEWHRGELAKYGVDARIAADDELETGQIVVLVEPGGERTMVTDRGANARLVAGDVPGELDVDLVLLSGYLFAEPDPRAVARAVIERAVRFAVDPGSRSLVAAVGPEEFLRWTAGAAMCFANRDEARVLTGESDPGAMAARLTRWYELAVVKLGAEGAIVAGRDGSVCQVPAVPVEAIDSTGAGDAFCAGFIAAWLMGADPATAGRAAVSVAATAVILPGARPPRVRDDI